MRLLYFSPLSFGGIADYARAQATALCDAGADVTLLVTPDFQTTPGSKHPVLRLLRAAPRHGARLARKLGFGRTILQNIATLERHIREEKFDRVLFGSDWPVDTPADAMAAVRSLGFTADEEQRIFYRNAAELLEL